MKIRRQRSYSHGIRGVSENKLAMLVWTEDTIQENCYCLIMSWNGGYMNVAWWVKCVGGWEGGMPLSARRGGRNVISQPSPQYRDRLEVN